jgi:signal transduction histidine kinase
MKETHRIRSWIIVAYLLSALNFIWDWYTPHGVADWVLYIPIILTPVWYNNARHVAWVSVACSVLVILGFFLSPSVDFNYFWAVMNRVFVLTALWLTAFAAMLMIHRADRLEGAMNTLSGEIELRKQTETHLIETEERLRLAMQGAGMGTWDSDLRTGKEIWSETQFALLGYEPTPGGVATTKMRLNRIHPDDIRRVLEIKERACNEHTVAHVEYRFVRADEDSIAWIEGFGFYHYDTDGKAVRYIGVSFDITRRKELESEVLKVATREQEEIGQELHDGVGQQLTGLRLMAEALADRLSEATEEKRIATRLVAVLDQVHQQIRDLSRGLVPVHVECGGLPAALGDLARMLTEQSGIAISSECPDWVDLPDNATSIQVFRIAREAVTNALRHGQAQHIQITLLSESDGLCLRVKDDGIGIQGQAGEGNGLGLHIMEYRTGLLGGVLRIERSEAGGTIGTLRLPRSSFRGEKAFAIGADAGNLDRG